MLFRSVFIATNASKKKYPIKENGNFDSSFSGEAVYEYVQITSDALNVRTYKLHSGELLDEINIYKP